MATTLVPRYLPQGWIVPALTPENRAFFTSGELRLQRCLACRAVQHPPEELCRTCQNMEFEYVPGGTRGVVESVSIVHYAVHAQLKASVPYNVVVVALHDHPDVRIVGNVVGLPLAEVVIGLRVEVVWADIGPLGGQGDTGYLPQWRAEARP